MDKAGDQSQERSYPSNEVADPDAGLDDLLHGDADDERPEDDEAAVGQSRSHRGHGGRERSEQDKWRRLAWVALVMAMGGGVLVLALTVFVLHEQNLNSERLIRLIQSGQHQLADEIQRNQEARQATLKAQQEDRQAALEAGQDERQTAVQSQREQAQNYRAQRGAAIADQAQSNAETRQAYANQALAQAEARRADAEAALASAQANAAKRSADRQAALTSMINNLSAQVDAAAQRVANRQADLAAAIDRLQAQGDSAAAQAVLDRQAALTEAINSLKRAIDELKSRG
ncbi:MAG: hypothetical protein ACRDO2_04390 [Nocardioidaceae bacterium]